MKFLSALVFSNIWISLGAVGTSTAFYILSQNTVNYSYLCLVFFATLFGYNLQYISGNKVSDNRLSQSDWLSRNSFTIRVITLVSLILSFFLSLYIIPFKVLLMSLPAFFLVFFYKKSKLNRISIRSIPMLKILVIAFCWMWVCSIIPQLLLNNYINWKASSFIFIYVLSITLPFDIRDYHFDEKSLMTVPNMLGVRATYFLSLILLTLLSVMALCFFNFRLFIFIVITVFLMIPSIKTQKEFYYLLILDGLLLVFPIFVE